MFNFNGLQVCNVPCTRLKEEKEKCQVLEETNDLLKEELAACADIQGALICKFTSITFTLNGLYPVPELCHLRSQPYILYIPSLSAEEEKNIAMKRQLEEMRAEKEYCDRVIQVPQPSWTTHTLIQTQIQRMCGA